MRRATPMLATAFAVAALLVTAGFTGSSAAAAALHCRPPTGPGDNLVHSGHVRAHHVSCRVARHVILASARNESPFTYAGVEWQCQVGAFEPGHTKARCESGPRKITWVWLD